MAKFSPSKMPQSVMEITTAVCPIVLLKTLRFVVHNTNCIFLCKSAINVTGKKKNKTVCIITSLKM